MVNKGFYKAILSPRGNYYQISILRVNLSPFSLLYVHTNILSSCINHLLIPIAGIR